jgi:hypothetical protein
MKASAGMPIRRQDAKRKRRFASEEVSRKCRERREGEGFGPRLRAGGRKMDG